jgi:hypothetical protein
VPHEEEATGHQMVDQTPEYPLPLRRVEVYEHVAAEDEIELLLRVRA